jgi:hypothetical protein
MDSWSFICDGAFLNFVMEEARCLFWLFVSATLELRGGRLLKF